MKIKTALFASIILAGSSVFADSTKPKISIQQALTSAQQAGYSDIQKIELEDGVWEINGRDSQGKEIEIKINSTTGALSKESD
ncbi:MAG: PepSY domain-containing protein [Tatlockia sp.]|nr:PepSY domain-containing protein [Tatlockia sp.]